MPKRDLDFRISWKVVLPATLAGRIEMMLLDPIHSKSIYGARGDLIVSLLEHWVALQEGREPPPIKSLMELRRSHA